MNLVRIAVTPEVKCSHKYNVFLTSYHLRPEEDQCIQVEMTASFSAHF